jgi:hypothetical protein
VKHPDVWGDPLDSSIDGPFAYTNLDIAATNGLGVVVAESGSMIVSLISVNGGMSYNGPDLVATEGEKPEIVGNSDGSFDCYYIHDGSIYKTHADDGRDWGEPVEVTGIVNLDADDMIDAAEDILVYKGNDDNLYAQVTGASTSLQITGIEVQGDTIEATVTNTGSTTQTNIAWEIKLESDYPLRGVFPQFEAFLKGRIWKGESTTGTINTLSSGDSTTITSDSISGFGFVNAVVTAGTETVKDDGFLILSNLYFRHPEE